MMGRQPRGLSLLVQLVFFYFAQPAWKAAPDARRGPQGPVYWRAEIPCIVTASAHYVLAQGPLSQNASLSLNPPKTQEPLAKRGPRKLHTQSDEGPPIRIASSHPKLPLRALIRLAALVLICLIPAYVYYLHKKKEEEDEEDGEEAPPPVSFPKGVRHINSNPII